MQYLINLTDMNGNPLIKHRRKTFVLGLIVAAKSLQNLAHELLTKENDPFKYILAYKLSQDHLELLFSCIRGKNGFNNNPNVIQLKSCLKRILLRNSIIGSKYANCMTFEEHSNGSIFSLKWSTKKSPVMSILKESLDLEYQEVAYLLENNNASTFREAILGYIAGFVVRKLLDHITCKTCTQSPISYSISEHSYGKSHLSLINCLLYTSDAADE